MGASAVLKLQKAGFSIEQVEALADFMDTQAASKADLEAAEHRLETKVLEVKLEVSEVRNDVALLSARVDSMAARIEQQGATLAERIERRHAESDAKIQGVKNDLIKYVIATGAASVLAIIGAVVMILRALPPH
ncbi:DUF1640 domain-containing protein [Azospirillaceae bacterium]